MTTIPEEYLQMSESQLYLELAGAVSGGHSSPPDPDEAERLGFNYFQKSLPQIRAAVCGSSIVTSLIKKDDIFVLASAIAEIIASHFMLPRAVATLSVLAARMGARRLCPTVGA